MLKSFFLSLGLLGCGLLAAADLYMAGDSTMQTYREKAYPQQGWGQRMQELAGPGTKVHNLSIGGRSTKSFKAQGRWDKLLAQLKKGDFVIIQFGHNDGARQKPERYAPPAEYGENLRQFVADVRRAGGIPVLVTSIPFGNFKDGKVNPARFLEAYLKSMREVAAETKCDLIDLNRYAVEEFGKMGEEKVTELYLVLKPGEYPNYPDGRKDRCHLSDKGALFYAEAVVRLAGKQKLPIAGLFKAPPAE